MAENHQAEEDAGEREQHTEADDERRGDAVELRDNDQEDEEQGNDQCFGEEGHLLGLLFLLSGEFPLHAILSGVVVHGALDGRDHLIGIESAEHIR